MVKAFQVVILCCYALAAVGQLLLALVPEGCGGDGHSDGVAVVVVLLLGLCPDEVESSLDLCGDWGRSRDGVSLGVEPVLVSDIGDLDDLAVVGSVLVGTLCDLGLCLRVARVLQVTTLLHCDPVTCLVAEQQEKVSYT